MRNSDVKMKREDAVRAVNNGTLPSAQFNKEWRVAVSAFKTYSRDAEFAYLLCQNVARTEKFLNLLFKRQKSAKADKHVVEFMRHPHLFNALSRGDNEHKGLEWISSLSTSECRADAVGAHAWLRNVLRRRNGSEFAQQALNVLNSLSNDDLARALKSSTGYNLFTVQSFLHGHATDILKRAGIEPK